MAKTAQAADAAWRRADEEQAFWDEKASEFQLHYPDQFVAVYNLEVVATASELVGLLDALKAQDLQPADVWVRYFSAHPMLLIL